MADIWMDVDAVLAEVPINASPLLDDTDFKSIEAGLTYDQAGLVLVWNFVTPAGAMTQTAVTPTTGGGDYDWTNQGNGIYSIGMPASGGASINNATEGFGWFTGVATGVAPWRGPVIGFRASGVNDLLIEGTGLTAWRSAMMSGTWTKAAVTATSYTITVTGIGVWTVDESAGTRTWADA